MYYYRARWYSPEVGRFLSVDPYPGSLRNPTELVNKYLYCSNNPINFVDPWGLRKKGIGEKLRTGWPYTAKSWLVKIGLGVGGWYLIRIPHPVAQIAGWTMLGTAAFLGIKAWYDLPKKAQDIAQDIYNIPGVREHYEELDQVIQEIENMNKMQ